ncbi:MAG: hypothetical protein CR979_00540, partial [Propionibacterium sp.]
SSGPLLIILPAVRCNPATIDRIRALLKQYHGATDVHLKLKNGAKTTLFKLDPGLRVDASGPLVADLKALLGPSCVATQ